MILSENVKQNQNQNQNQAGENFGQRVGLMCSKVLRSFSTIYLVLTWETKKI